MSDLSHLMNTTITIQRRSSTKDSSGGQAAGGSFTSVTGLSGIPALVQPTHGKAMRATGQRQVFLSHHIYLSQQYAIQRGDRMLHDDSGRYFIVHGFEDMGGQARAWRLECVEET